MHRTNTRRLIASLVALAGLCAAAPITRAQTAAEITKPASDTGPARAEAADARIDVVFVLDTTGSMSGLIEGAKQKIWSIANQIASAKPHPQIRMALVAYRDRGDAYVTQITDLTDDLDAVYSNLMKLTADGGGDTPESVNQALHEAVTKIAWANKADNYLKLVYLVGDAPPHMDYDQDVKYQESCRLAAGRGIIINTIQCGGIAETTPIWQEIARGAEGEYFQIDQNGGVTAIATPYDADLANLGIELEKTVVAYGDADAQQAQATKMGMSAELAAAAPARPEAAAERVAFKASDAGRACLTGRNDLVQACKDGTVSLDTLKDEELPEHMRKMAPEERKAYIARQVQARDACIGKVKELNDKRQEFIKQQLAQAGATDAFDAKVLAALRVQAARCGIRYGERE
jgi:Mg-chelatase subunit ChlD